MKIQYLFSKNKKIGSYLIRFGSYLISKTKINYKIIPSHVAVLIDDTYVIESVMHGGVRIIPYNKWLEVNIEIHKLDAKTITEHPKDLMFEMWGKKYDFKGILYFTCCIIKNKIFKTPLPEINKWEQENCYFCTEFASRIYDGNTGSMRTPLQLMELING